MQHRASKQEIRVPFYPLQPSPTDEMPDDQQTLQSIGDGEHGLRENAVKEGSETFKAGPGSCMHSKYGTVSSTNKIT